MTALLLSWLLYLAANNRLHLYIDLFERGGDGGDGADGPGRGGLRPLTPLQPLTITIDRAARRATPEEVEEFRRGGQ